MQSVSILIAFDQERNFIRACLESVREFELPDDFSMEIIVLVRGDITVALSVNRLIRERSIDTIIHFATESLLDRSITGPAAFINTNIVGTYTLLEAARTAWLSERKRDDARFHHVSTDEDFGRLSEAICYAVRRRHIRPAHRTRPARQAPITSPARIITRLGYWPR